ncbi:MAG: hypothetical protein NHB32_03630 [Fischerella sp. CENA71]|nr:hypothetical protein [Fischerella sp. CENA71]
MVSQFTAGYTPVVVGFGIVRINFDGKGVISYSPLINCSQWFSEAGDRLTFKTVATYYLLI